MRPSSSRLAAPQVTPLPGLYDGYEVHTCGNSATDLGIRGVGSKIVSGIDDVWSAGNEVCDSVRDIGSLLACGGIGDACGTVGTMVDLNDWRDVDTVIARVGTLLHDRDWSLEVGLTVRGPDRPQ